MNIVAQIIFNIKFVFLQILVLHNKKHYNIPINIQSK